MIQLRQYEYVVGSFRDIWCAAVKITLKYQCTASLGGCSIYMSLPGHVLAKLQNCDFRFFFDLAESKVAVFLCSILTSDGVPFCFGKNSFP